MSTKEQQQLGKTLWDIADNLRGAMNADDFRDYMLSFLFLRYLSYNYEEAAKKELGKDYPDDTPYDVMSKLKSKTPLEIWYHENSKQDVIDFEKQMRRKAHYVIKPEHLWSNITELARTQNDELLVTLEAGFRYIENESFESAFQGLFSEINLNSEKLGKNSTERNKKLCTII
jgi:type I restriction enzyme M protein